MFMLAMALPQTAAAGFGDLDASFAQGGKFVLPKALGEDAWTTGLKVRTDGKVLLSVASVDRSPGVIMRLTRGGSVDKSFGVDGYFRAKRGLPSSPVLLANGRIAFLERDGAHVELSVLRSDGKPDKTFGGGGRLVLRDGTTGFDARVAAAQGSSILVAGGSVGTAVTAVMRYDASGRLDSSFGASGVATIPSTRVLSIGPKLAVSGSNEIFVGLDSFETSPGAQAQSTGVAKLSPSGSPVAGFGDGGVAKTNVSGFAANGVIRLALVPDGRVLVVSSGAIHGGGKGNESWTTTLLDRDGSAIAVPEGMSSGTDVVALSDSSFVAVGMLLLAFRPDFTPDASFNGSGPSLAFLGCGKWRAPEVGPDDAVLAVSADDNVGDCDPPKHRQYVMRMLGPTGGKVAPQVQITSSVDSVYYRRGRLKHVFDGVNGVAAPANELARVRVAIQRVDSRLLKRRSRCRWVTAGGASTALTRAVRGECSRPRFMSASGKRQWSFVTTSSLPAGQYRLFVRATTKQGVSNPLTRLPDSYRRFTVKRR